jgi:hypothetical protein
MRLASAFRSIFSLCSARPKCHNHVSVLCARYATFAHLAGIDVNELPQGPAPIDSINMWPYLTGDVTASPRQEVVYDHRRTPYVDALAAAS